MPCYRIEQKAYEKKVAEGQMQNSIHHFLENWESELFEVFAALVSGNRKIFSRFLKSLKKEAEAACAGVILVLLNNLESRSFSMDSDEVRELAQKLNAAFKTYKTEFQKRIEIEADQTITRT